MSGEAVPTPAHVVRIARLALQDGAIDAERLIAMLRVRRYQLRRMLLCGNDVEIEVGCAGQAAADLLEPRLRRILGLLLLSAVSGYHSGTMAEQPPAALTYSAYLELDRLLNAQRPRSGEHDEMLFIVVHQVYELWFKQLLHEFAFLQERLEAGDTAHALATVGRVLTILKTAVAQVDVLETMTPRQFLSFRVRLDQASGFQSAQFRELEAVLGRRGPELVADHPGSATHPRVGAAMSRPAMFDSLLRHLALAGYAVPDAALHRDVSTAWEGSVAVQDMLLDVYRDDGAPAQLCERFVDLDEGLQEWRYRHVKMVERTIGDRGGTGGSSGVRYLRTTVFRPVFPDLWAIRRRL